MRDQTCHQDWETVVLKKQTLPSLTPTTNQSNKCKADDNEIEKPKKVSTLR